MFRHSKNVKNEFQFFFINLLHFIISKVFIINQIVELVKVCNYFAYQCKVLSEKDMSPIYIHKYITSYKFHILND